jgi:hypothetical protein
MDQGVKYVCKYRSGKLLVGNESDKDWTLVTHNQPAPLSWEIGLNMNINVWTPKGSDPCLNKGN